ncbi:hypothetical protein V490_09314 [Pseudogymnoascus sp. VKM F-3557]|nr:hypothetical protein V490_09314 [Pseudogymnoascus sp. VKM F-3557]
MNDECHEIMRSLRIDADIPRVQWTGLNAAWPAVQGFRMDRAPCKNKVCLAKVPHGAGFTLCYICTTFKDAKGRLPTSVEVSRLMSEGQKLEAARAKAGPNPPCGDCGRREDFFPVKHLTHHLAPGVLLCGACIMQLKTHGVMHTPEEKAKLVGVSALISRRRTEEVHCDNCAVPESSQLTWQHTYNAEVGQSDFFLTLVAILPFLGEVMQYYADHQVELEFITKYLGVIVVVFGLAVVGVVGLRATVWVVRIVATVMPP